MLWNAVVLKRYKKGLQKHASVSKGQEVKKYKPKPTQFYTIRIKLYYIRRVTLSFEMPLKHASVSIGPLKFIIIFSKLNCCFPEKLEQQKYSICFFEMSEIHRIYFV